MAAKIPVTDRVLRSASKKMATPKKTAVATSKATPKPKVVPKAKAAPKAKVASRPNATQAKNTKAQAAKKALRRSLTQSTTGLVSPNFATSKSSEAALRSRASQNALEMLSAMYFDINGLCSLQKIVQNEYDFAAVAPWQNQIDEAKGAVQLEVLTAVERYKQLENAPAGEKHRVNRLYQFVEAYGWRLFSICLHAEAFRRAFRNTEERLWNTLFSAIGENQLSLEVFAISRQLQWREPLEYIRVTVKNMKDLPLVTEALSEEPYWGFHITHPHDFAITLNGEVQNTYFNGKPRAVIYENEWNTKRWGCADPTLRSSLPNIGKCMFCKNGSPCSCRLVPLAGGMVELREYPVKGIGVRALGRFDNNDILGVFVGEVYPYEQLSEDDPDQTYALTQFPNTIDPGVGEILPHFKGNWTRFINHSCQPTCSFENRYVGDRLITTIEAIRHIQPFEEITVDYGPRYWEGRDRVCECGHWNCAFREK
jgi:hypothetical protein